MAEFVHIPGEPPSLVIHDGTTILVLRPADLGDGLVAAAQFAEALIQVVSEWESGCRRTLDATQPDGPDQAQTNPPHTTPPPDANQPAPPRPQARPNLITSC